MTDKEYRIAYLKKHHINEKWAFPIFYNALKAQIKPVIEYVTKFGIVGLENYPLSTEPIYKAFELTYQNIAKKEAKWEYYNVLKRPEQKSISFFYEAWQRMITDFILTNGGAKITGITETTREQIRYLIAVTTDQNMTAFEAAKYIVNEMMSKDFLFRRALVIARTETTTASNYGHLLTAETLEILTEKKWIATEDNRTRRSHLIADGLKVAKDEKFEIGSSLMNAPGDATAPAKEVVNCRCVVRLVPVYDANGLPVRKPVNLISVGA